MYLLQWYYIYIFNYYYILEIVIQICFKIKLDARLIKLFCTKEYISNNKYTFQ